VSDLPYQAELRRLVGAQKAQIADRDTEIERLKAEIVQLKADLLAAQMGLKEVRGE